MRILVLSTFDVWPPRDGGQNRYVNLWCNFPPGHEITILSYEFRNLTGERRYRLSEHVRVVVPAASEGDAKHFHHMAERTGLWLHDVLCLADYQFSAAFRQRLAEELQRCDAVVASHPYLAPLAFPLAPSHVLKVYESYNVEYDIKKDYFASGRGVRLAELLEAVATGERYAAVQADIVTAVSESDRTRLTELYGIPASTTAVVPNGANIRTHDLLDARGRRDVRAHLDLPGGLVGIFLGSAYPANVESYRRGRDMLQAAGFTGTVLLVGSINQAPRHDWPEVGFGERWFGFVETEVKDVLLSASDFALHLIFAGAGTNLKLFDYMGAGTLIIANEFGRRGVDGDDWCLTVDTAEELKISMAAIQDDLDTNNVSIFTTKAREIAIEKFDWQSISKYFENLIRFKLA